MTLVVAPLFHIGGLNVTTLLTWFRGRRGAAAPLVRSPAFLDDIGRYGVTTVFAVPAMLLFVSQCRPSRRPTSASLRLVICGGAPVPEPLMKRFNDRGVPINQGYGLTETAPTVTFLMSEFGLSKLGSAGRTPVLIDVRLADPEGGVVTEPTRRARCA